MCRLCEKKPVYEFTNKRKLCARCFINYFQKKTLYIIRKFGMIRNREVVVYENKSDFRGIVLEDILKMFSEKANVEIVKSYKLPAANSSPNSVIEKLLLIKRDSRFPITSPTFKKSVNTTKNLLRRNLAEPVSEHINKRANIKIAITSTIDATSDEIIHKLIRGNIINLKKLAPVQGKIIKPLYLFLDEEVLLYATLKKLKFRKIKEKKDKISNFIDDLEKKHPEIKRAVVNSYLELN